MGKIKQGVLGGYSGKVGPTTGSSWKGIHIIKSRPQSVAYPGTSGQVAQTNNMKAIVAFVKPLVSQWVKPLWDRFASMMSGYNAFVQANISNWVNGTLTTPEDLIFSQGSMLAQPFTAVESVTPDNVVFTWDNDDIEDPLALATDIAFAMVLDENFGFIGFKTVATRDDETITVVCPSGSIVPGNYICLLAFKAKNGTRVSNTYVTGMVITPTP